MSQQPFVDYYEVLQLSPNAAGETLERVYRLLAKRYHPDNPHSGDSDRFAEVLEAYRVLSDPERRAQYDIAYDEKRATAWRIFDQKGAEQDRSDDQRIFHGILSLLYVARRRNPRAGGLGAVHLERLLGVPEQHLEFPIWYLRQHGWIEVLDTGQFAITVHGIDKISSLQLPPDRLISAPGANADSGVTPADPAQLEREASGEE